MYVSLYTCIKLLSCDTIMLLHVSCRQSLLLVACLVSSYPDSAFIILPLCNTLHHATYFFDYKGEMQEIESNPGEMFRLGDLSNLSAEKLQELETLLKSILALPVARDTYAQIIDGTPTRTAYSDEIKAMVSPLSETIIISDDSESSDRAMQLYEEVKKSFAPQGLKIDLKARTSSFVALHLIKPNFT